MANRPPRPKPSGSSMTVSNDGPPKRKDIRQLTPDEKDNLIRAFLYIQNLKPGDRNSFFCIAGYHGEPFRGAGWGDPKWWGGFCNHGNILFPTWHRAYLWRLEQALRTAPGCGSLALPYWNEISDSTLSEGIPSIFLQKTYQFKNGDTVDNPLYSYTFQAPISDNLTPIPDADYSKPKGYKTVRYPFSGLVGPNDIDKTNAHNQVMDDLGSSKTNQYLNDNVQIWLNLQTFKNTEGAVIHAGEKDKYLRCLNAPNYTVFSNTTSAQQWNEDRVDDDNFIAEVPLESPHNAIHLAVGGFEVPGSNFNRVSDANGDMGENDTAAFDPIFFFHHCFIDMMFWKWQTLHDGATNKLDIIEHYAGTNSVDSQGPTPGVAGGTWLTLDSALDPFVKDGKPMTSKDVVNIKNLGYDYKMPDFDEPVAAVPTPHIRISGINRASIGGSFFVSAWAFKSNAEPLQLVGIEPVLSRWHVSGCANCSNHLEVKAFFPLTGWNHEDAKNTSFEGRVHTKGDRQGLKAPVGVPRLRLGGLPKQGGGVPKPRLVPAPT